MKKFLALMAALFALCGAAYFYATPFAALLELKQGIEARDKAVIAAVVDFPSVRENLKSQVNEKVAKEAAEADPIAALGDAIADPVGALGNVLSDPVGALGGAVAKPVAALGGIVAAEVTGAVIDRIVTPEGMITLLERGILPTPGGGGGADEFQMPSAKTLKKWLDSVEYQTLNRFAVHVEGSDSPVTLVLERGNAFGDWRVVEVHLLH